MFDDFYYSMFIKDLRRISGRIEMGLEDNNDITIAMGILQLLIDSNQPQNLREVERTLTKSPELKRFLNGRYIPLT